MFFIKLLSTVIVLSTLSSYAIGQDQCHKLFINQVADLKISNKVIHQAKKLGISIDPKKEVITTYLEILRYFESLQNKLDLSEELVSLLHHHFEKDYDLPDNQADLVIFYKNAVHSLYARIGLEIKKQELAELLHVEPNAYERLVFYALLDGYSLWNGLGSDLVTANGARQYLLEKPWDTYPFMEAQEILKMWQQSESFRDGFLYFQKWYHKNDDLLRLAPRDLDRLVTAILRSEKLNSTVFCCKSSSACKICPHNRLWLKAPLRKKTGLE